MRTKTTLVKWDSIDALQHNLKSDITYVNGTELAVRQAWVKHGFKEDIDPIIRRLNELRWRLMDRVEQINDIITEGD